MALKPAFVILSLIVLVHAIDRDVCVADLRNRLRNGTLNANDQTFFWDTPASLNPEIPLSLTVDACTRSCGKGFTWYTGNEIANRIVGWLIPVLVSECATG
jgi:hypothetical protein